MATKGTVKIKVPLVRGENEDLWVAVNGRSYLIKRGIYVDVPAAVAEVIQHSEEMEARAIEYEASAREGLL
jgi:hypothetical protein